MSSNPKLDLLKSMVAGIPTKESQELSLKTKIYADSKNIGNLNTEMLKEMVEELPLPSAYDDAVVSTMRPSVVSEDDILALMQGKKPIHKAAPAPQQMINENLIEEMEMEERSYGGDFNIHEELKRRLENKQNQLQEAKTVSKPVSAKNVPADDLTSLIEDTIYKVLAQIINEAVKRKMGI